MFNKGLFNRLLFNRVLALFRDAEQINLLGEYLGFSILEGLFQPELSLIGIQNLTTEQYGNFSFTQDLDGSYKIFYNLEGELITILEEGLALQVIEVLGEAVDVIESGKIVDTELDGENKEVILDGKD